MIKEIYDFATPYGPLGQFIDKTPTDRITRVFLEEKMFETWHHGRVVLIGDGRTMKAVECYVYRFLAISLLTRLQFFLSLLHLPIFPNGSCTQGNINSSTPVVPIALAG